MQLYIVLVQDAIDHLNINATRWLINFIKSQLIKSMAVLNKVTISLFQLSQKQQRKIYFYEYLYKNYI